MTYLLPKIRQDLTITNDKLKGLMDAFDLFFNKKLIKYEFSKKFTLKNSY
jgi:hypothetical protein